MQELSIKVVIAGRMYPLTIKRENEETVRKAVKLIEERLKDYSDNYSVKDKQDLLAMCSLHFVNQYLELEGKQTEDDVESVVKLHEINELLDSCLKSEVSV